MGPEKLRTVFCKGDSYFLNGLQWEVQTISYGFFGDFALFSFQTWWLWDVSSTGYVTIMAKCFSLIPYSAASV